MRVALGSISSFYSKPGVNLIVCIAAYGCFSSAESRKAYWLEKRMWLAGLQPAILNR
jgi:hypothetical protein